MFCAPFTAFEEKTVTRGASTFRLRDLTRAVRAARAAGIEVQSIEIDPASGKITITAPPAAKQIDDLDKWLASNAH